MAGPRRARAQRLGAREREPLPRAAASRTPGEGGGAPHHLPPAARRPMAARALAASLLLRRRRGQWQGGAARSHALLTRCPGAAPRASASFRTAVLRRRPGAEGPVLLPSNSACSAVKALSKSETWMRHAAAERNRGGRAQSQRSGGWSSNTELIPHALSAALSSPERCTHISSGSSGPAWIFSETADTSRLQVTQHQEHDAAAADAPAQPAPSCHSDFFPKDSDPETPGPGAYDVDMGYQACLPSSPSITIQGVRRPKRHETGPFATL
ncbi:protein STPG3 [Lagopus leucura]|uniref:protein STPG3 n=1 Tax=Lagopus leucura TaxID=30410 RepID=UPI001C66A440|nr:protein STPG3 [Lagopus leucura]